MITKIELNKNIGSYIRMQQQKYGSRRTEDFLNKTASQLNYIREATAPTRRMANQYLVATKTGTPTSGIIARWINDTEDFAKAMTISISILGGRYSALTTLSKQTLQHNEFSLKEYAISTSYTTTVWTQSSQNSQRQKKNST